MQDHAGYRNIPNIKVALIITQLSREIETGTMGTGLKTCEAGNLCIKLFMCPSISVQSGRMVAVSYMR